MYDSHEVHVLDHHTCHFDIIDRTPITTTSFQVIRLCRHCANIQRIEVDPDLLTHEDDEDDDGEE